jgi:excisionase family DNA binding protein
MKKKTKRTSAEVYSNPEELADDLGIGRTNIYYHLRTGRIPHIRLGDRYLIPRAAIQEWLRTAGRSFPTLRPPAPRKRKEPAP